MDFFSLFVGDDLWDFIAVETIRMQGEIWVQSVCDNTMAMKAWHIGSSKMNHER